MRRFSGHFRESVFRSTLAEAGVPRRPRILLLGATGQIGWELSRSLAPLGDLVAACRTGDSGARVDLAELGALGRLLEGVGPDVIVNAAAYTAVDRAEAEPQLAHRINAAVPGLIGEWAAKAGATVVHYSTDYVFDGSKVAPYVEEDLASPLSVYGRSKLAGDEALLATRASVLILRVGWVYGLRGHNFLRTMQRLMSEREHLAVVDDQVGAPTWSRLIAEASAAVLAQLLRGCGGAQAHSGLYHLSPSGETSWYGFAEEIRRLGGYHCQIEPIPSSQYPTSAVRPANSRLDSRKLTRVFGVALPHWREGLAMCLGTGASG